MNTQEAPTQESVVRKVALALLKLAQNKERLSQGRTTDLPRLSEEEWATILDNETGTFLVPAQKSLNEQLRRLSDERLEIMGGFDKRVSCPVFHLFMDEITLTFILDWSGFARFPENPGGTWADEPCG